MKQEKIHDHFFLRLNHIQADRFFEMNTFLKPLLFLNYLKYRNTLKKNKKHQPSYDHFKNEFYDLIR